MAVMNRNPMPLSGALFVTNPRRRRNAMALQRRKMQLKSIDDEETKLERVMPMI